MDISNKLLKRLFKKYLKISKPEEFSDLMNKLGQVAETTDSMEDARQFIGRFGSFLVELEKAVQHLEDTVKIRDRSLKISSAESTELNDRIREAAEQKESVLAKLNEIVKLSAKGKPQDHSEFRDNNENLTTLVSKVEELVFHHLENTRLLKLLFDESHKVSGSLNFYELSKNSERAFNNLYGRKIESSLYYSTRLFQEQSGESFHIIQKDGRLDKSFALKEDAEKTYIFINDSKDSKLLAVAEVAWPNDESPSVIEFYTNYIKSMSSVIANSISSIKFLESEKNKQHMENELKTARFVQNTLLPPPIDQQILGLNICGYYRSASECGGDWWNIFPVDSHRVLVFIGDVTGHGTASAILGAVVKGYCDSYLFRELPSTTQILKELNSVIYTISTKSERCMSMFCAIIDQKNLSITYSNAGHNTPLLLKNEENKKIEYLVGNGPILGMKQESEFTEHRIDFTSGDTFFLYTDGLVECYNPESAMYGDRRLERLLKKIDGIPKASGWIKSVLTDMENFRCNAELEDDVTLLAINLS